MAEKVGGLPSFKTILEHADQSKGLRTRKGFRNSFTASAKSKYDISFDHAVDLMSGDFYLPSTVSQYNRLWVEVAPNTDLDALVSGAAISTAVTSTDTEVVVNAQAKGALDAFLDVDGDVQVEEVYFRLTSVPGDPTDFTDLRVARWDSTNSKLLSPDGSAFNLTASASDKIFVTVRWEDGTYIAPGSYIRIGDETLTSSNLPANTTIRFIIENDDITALDIAFNLTYLHD